MPKDGLEMALNPELIVMMPIAVIIDLIGIILIFFGLDDFGITDIIGFIFIGGWSLFRSQITPAPEAQVQMPSLGEKRAATKEFKKMRAKASAVYLKDQKTAKAAKSAKWAKRIKLLELIPYVGVLPLWTISVYMTVKYS